MTDYFTQNVILAVKERDRSYYNNNQLLTRTIANVSSLRPGEVPIRIRLRVPKSFFRGMGPIDVIVEEEPQVEVQDGHAR